MRLKDILTSSVLDCKNWVLTRDEEDPDSHDNPHVREVSDFSKDDNGLFSSILKMNDGSENPALIVKAFKDGGLNTDTYVHTKVGWLNILEEGFMRAIGKYPGDVFPYDIFIGRPWHGDKELAREGASKIQEHMGNFEAAVERLREKTPQNK